MAFSDTTAAADGQSKRAVTGYPLLARPGDHRFIRNGYSQVRTSSPPPTYMQQLFQDDNQHYRVQKLHKGNASICVVSAASLCCFFISGSLLLIAWFFLCPHLPEVHLASATLFPLGTTASSVSVACNVSLLLTNHNRRLTVYYNRVELFVGYQPLTSPLLSAQLPPFVQPEKNHTVVHAQMEISDATVGNDVVQALKADLVRGSISAVVKAFVLVRFEGQDCKTRSRLIRVYCDGVILEFSSVNGHGNMVNPYKDCRVDM